MDEKTRKAQETYRNLVELAGGQESAQEVDPEQVVTIIERLAPIILRVIALFLEK